MADIGAGGAGEAYCSRLWDERAEPVWGTATRAAFWVALEQPGPWGELALTQSRLDPTLGGTLEASVRAAGGRILLIRAVDDHRRDGAGAPRRVYVAAGGAAGSRWLLQGLVTDPADLLGLPWAALAAGNDRAALAALPELTPCPSPVLFVCTNGKRDRCCAVRARAVVAYAAGQRGEAVWECTHTGGHRYAPTGVVLPYGAMFARLDGPGAVAALDAAAVGRLPAGLAIARHLRGLAHLDPGAQAADAWVRQASGETAYDALTVTADVALGGTDEDTERSYVVRHADGRSWPVRVTARRYPAPPPSCGKPATEETTYVVTSD